MSGSDPKWRDKWVDIAAKIYAIGGTTETIAQTLNSIFGSKFTKNAVIGKINRQRAAGDIRFINPKPEVINGKPIQGLLELWKEGASSVEIADQYGVSRSTVGAKAAQYGLKPRPTNHTNKKQKEDLKKANKFTCEPFKSRNVFVSPKSLGLSLMDLSRNQCRFVIGDGPYLFCGLTVQEGSSVPYCRSCKRVMYQPRMPRMESVKCPKR